MAASELVEGADAGAASGERSTAYRVVEGAHLRQWLSRLAMPVAVAATNGAGLLDVPWLPRHDAPLRVLGLPAATTTGLRVTAVLLIVAAVWLRTRSKGVLVRRTTLTTGGVYARVRHPFYVAVMLGALGVLALAGPVGALAAGVWLVLAVPVYSITVAGEEDGLSTLFPQEWSDYAASVPRLLPAITPRGRGAQQVTPVSWRNLVAEHEPPRLLRYLGGVLIVAGCVAGDAGGWSLVAAGVGAFALSRLLPGIRPRSRRDRARDRGASHSAGEAP